MLYYMNSSNKKEEDKLKFSDDEDEDEDEDDGDGFYDYAYDFSDTEDDDEKKLMKDWKDRFQYRHIKRLTKNETRTKEEAMKLWQWTPNFKDVAWGGDEDQLRSVEYQSYVWSPYAIPRAVDLFHYWYCHVRYQGSDFQANWKYHLLNFDDGDDAIKKRPDYVILCSNKDNGDGDETIVAHNLNSKTVDKIRTFLYGTSCEEHKRDFCCDYDFLYLLFSSMGTIDTMEGLKDCRYGYVWKPDEVLQEKLMKEKVPIRRCSYDVNGEPGKRISDYSMCWVPWLEYYFKKVANSLDPITKHFSIVKKRKRYEEGESDY